MRFLRELLLLPCLGSLAVTGCMPSYTFEARPLPPPPRDAPERCYHDERVEVAGAGARWSYMSGSAYGTVQQHSFSSGGLTFYKGGKRLTVPEALDVLGDRDLTAEYGRKLSETSASHTIYPISTTSAFVLAGGGLALTGVALGQVLSWSSEERANNDIPVTLWIGAGVALAAIIPTILSWKTYDGAVAHDRGREIFQERSLAPRLEGSIRAHNQEVARRCGHPLQGDDDLPASPSLTPAPPRGR